MPLPERLEGHLAEPPRLERRGAGEEHPAGVAVPAVQDHGDVDVEDVALLQPPLARNAVADLVVDRGADRLRVAAVVEGRRDRAVRADELLAQPVELARGDPRLDLGRDHVEHRGREPPGPAHAGEGGLRRAAAPGPRSRALRAILTWSCIIRASTREGSSDDRQAAGDPDLVDRHPAHQAQALDARRRRPRPRPAA